MSDPRNGWYEDSGTGNKIHYVDGKFHLEDGPAVVWADGYLAWYRHGIRHRDDGPARIWPDGREEFWLNGIQIHPLKFFVNQKIDEKIA